MFSNSNSSLTEHLNYFSESLAADLSKDDFDAIFPSPDACTGITSMNMPMNMNTVEPYTPVSPTSVQRVGVFAIQVPLACKAVHPCAAASTGSDTSTTTTAPLPLVVPCPLMVVSNDEDSTTCTEEVGSVSCSDNGSTNPCQSASFDMSLMKPSGKRKRSNENRRERNRKHAMKSRQRKKDFTQELQLAAKALKEENEYLSSLIQQRQLQLPASCRNEGEREDAMVKELQKHRVLDAESLAALRDHFVDPSLEP